MNEIHIFEKAGLGKAPFKVTGISENLFSIPGVPGSTKPGGSCDYCSTSIRYEFHIVSADGKRSKVGCDCINKAGDAGIRRQTDSLVKERKRAAKREKDTAVAAELNKFIFDRQNELASLPHPMGYSDRKTGARLSKLDWARWMDQNCGASGKAAVLRRLKSEHV
jgi:hypothetical protein